MKARQPKTARPNTVKPKHNTIAVRFLAGETLHKVYTYRVRRGAKVHLGQELIVPTPRGNAVAIAVEIHTRPQDDGPYDYKFVIGKVAPL